MWYSHDPVRPGYWITGDPTTYGSATLPVTPTGGGIGHGGKKKRVFIERDGEYLLFKSSAEAAMYISAEKVETEQPRIVVKKAKKPKQVIPVKLDTKALEDFYRGKEYELQQSIAELLRLEDFDTLLMLQLNLIEFLAKQARDRDEEDVEILLLM